MFQTKVLYEQQAQAGQDYEQVTGSSILINDSVTVGEIPLRIKADSMPELNELFIVTLTGVELVGGPPSNPSNNPQLGTLREAHVTIATNDDANGVFSILSRDPRALDGGRLVPVEEREKLSVELVVVRAGKLEFFNVKTFRYYRKSIKTFKLS